eukprot:gb/GEZN01003886.1/.p1 GENE.gb/GEZN01003886.1/~~gb/GEZN01003886.1/.p1  ORF type:complete len:487 (+),score=69.93 gb/GEZN01003886.1/:229-1689(+)
MAKGGAKEDELEGDLSRLQAGRRWVFLATFINYAFAHWTRKCYTNVKVQFIHGGVSPLTLASMDSAFMLTYAGGSFFTGALGDRFSAVNIISMGLLGSSLCLAALLWGISSTVPVAASWFVAAQTIHGFAQATGGPVNTAIMGEWFGSDNRGLIFGLWTCHQYVGDVIAAFAGALILSLPINWRWVILIPLVINGFWAGVNFFFVPNSPRLAGINYSSNANVKISSDGEHQKLPPMPIIKAICIPNVLSYACAFGFFKLVNYAMFFQLPLILTANFTSSTANLISSLYSFGMMPGGIVCGWLSDLYGGRRALVCATMMCFLVPLLILFAFYMDQLPIVVVLALLCLMGCLVGGPNNIITSAVATDLSEHPATRGYARATGTVTGIINGSGSVVAALGQIAIPYLSAAGKRDGVSYRYVWLFLVLSTILGTALMWPKIYEEITRPSAAPAETQPLRPDGNAYTSEKDVEDGAYQGGAQRRKGDAYHQ